MSRLRVSSLHGPREWRFGTWLNGCFRRGHKASLQERCGFWQSRIIDRQIDTVLIAAYASGFHCMGWARLILARQDGIAVPVRILAEKLDGRLSVIENALHEERSCGQAMQEQEGNCPCKEALIDDMAFRRYHNQH
jgi:hypothetical protein